MDGDSVWALVERNASVHSGRAALLGTGGEALSHAQLCARVDDTVRSLNGLGVGRGDRVAVVLPQGPELALALLCAMSTATVAPLNPGYRAADFEFYLSDLGASALILLQGDGSPARRVARALGLPVIELEPEPSRGAGGFRLLGERAPARRPGFARADELALVLHTSGTTSRPKIVPLTQANVCRSASHIVRSLRLQPTDRCLGVMPLFHIHGLVAGVLASLAAGGSVICAPPFDASRFFVWLDEGRPSWYTAVPTMHQAILAQAASGSTIPGRPSLRFVRSSSAALPPAVMEALERTFGAPVIEAYGMTEAAHQMTSNPLPPRTRKPGSAGVAAGPEVAIMDAGGGLLETGCTGEIVIRGPNVASGYENNPRADAAAFDHGWFRTGDEGRLDGDGYLFISGRLKEMINRGGEKVAPREIDEALLRHPAVVQAVAFATVHPTLGEDVAVAVVLAPGAGASETELRDFAARHLPDFKVPSRIVFVAEIPKGPTGKVQRIGLAARLAADLAVSYEPPRDELERLVVATFEQVLPHRPLGRNDNFFASGGDSLRGMQAVARLAGSLALEIPAATLFRRPTPALLAAALVLLQQESEVQRLGSALAQLPPGEAASLLAEGPGGATS